MWTHKQPPSQLLQGSVPCSLLTQPPTTTPVYQSRNFNPRTRKKADHTLVNTSKSLSMQLYRFRAAYTVLLPHPKLYITDWYGIGNLPIPQSDPREHSLKNSKAWTGPLHFNSQNPFLRPTEECSHSTHTGHRVEASHFHLLFILHVYRVTKNCTL